MAYLVQAPDILTALAKVLKLILAVGEPVSDKREVLSVLLFTERWSSLDEWQRIQEDLEQVLILFTLQRYKRIFVQGMARILSWGAGFFGAFLVLALLLYALPRIADLWKLLTEW